MIKKSIALNFNFHRKSFAFFFGSIFCMSAQASLEPYVGIDMQQRNMNFQKNYGANIFSRKLMQNNIYLGVRPIENFGLELGHQSSQNSSKTTMVLEGDYLLGQLVNPAVTAPNEIPFILTQTSIRTQGTHLNVIKFFPTKYSQTEFVAALGLTVLSVKFQYKQLADSELGSYAAEDVLDTTRNFSSRRVIPRAMVGIQQKWTELLGFRASFVYENTRKFKQMLSKDVTEGLQLPGDRELKASLRNSITYGLGVFMTF